MNGIGASISAHSTLWILGVWWVFSAAVSAMPQPKADADQFYMWVFGFLHTLAGSIGAIMQKKFPEATQTIQQTETHPLEDGGVATTTVKETGPKQP